MTPNTSAIRRAAYRILEPGAWCQGAFARDAYGRVLVYSSSPFACQWCAAGALGIEGYGASWDIYAIKDIAGGWLDRFNDLPDTTAEDMATLLLFAAEVMEEA